MTLDQVVHLLKPNPNSAVTKIGEFKTYARLRYCQTLGGCSDWIIGNDNTYSKIDLGWSDGTPVHESQIRGLLLQSNGLAEQDI